MKINDLYTAYVSWAGGGKRRPVLVLNVDKKNVLVFKVTTKYKDKPVNIKKHYYAIQDMTSTGLYKQSYIDTITKVSLSLNRVSFKRIGELSTVDIDGLERFINKLKKHN